jgi:hypothetical protein
VREQVSHQHKTTGNITVLYDLNVMFLDTDGKAADSELNGRKLFLNLVNS